MSSARILIIEDEPILLRVLKDTFLSNGFDVITATDGVSGLVETAIEKNPDLILLDIMLPKANGYEICRSLREQGVTMPVLMLTAKGQEEDIVLGLNLGADDYVIKPFRARELLARVKAFLRRRHSDPTACVFGAFRLDPAAHKLFRDGREVELTAKEFRLLEYFASRPGRALARNDILDAVWGRSVMVTGRSVDRCVATLRAKVETDPHNPDYIQTIRDIGYRFEPDPREKD